MIMKDGNSIYLDKWVARAAFDLMSEF
jgi:hypothetical protein